MSYSAFARFYDQLTDNVHYGQRAAYFDRILRAQLPKTELRLSKTELPPSKTESGLILLDLACGTGSLSLPMAKLGYDVIGVDSSPEMLSVAMQKKSEQDEEASSGQGSNSLLFLCQKMEELDLYGTIDAAVCALDSLNHITDEKTLQRVFDKVSLFMNPNGIFVFDVNSVYKHKETLGDNVFVFDREEVYCVWQNHFSAKTNVVEINLDFFEYDKEEKAYFRSSESFCERAYPHEAILAFLKHSGLELVAVYGDDSVEPPAPEAQRLVYVARKGK